MLSAYSIFPPDATTYRAAGIVNVRLGIAVEGREIDPQAHLDGARSSSRAFQRGPKACATSDRNGTGIYVDQSHDRLQRRGLAYAVAADDAEHLSLGHA